MGCYTFPAAARANRQGKCRGLRGPERGSFKQLGEEEGGGSKSCPKLSVTNTTATELSKSVVLTSSDFKQARFRQSPSSHQGPSVWL